MGRDGGYAEIILSARRNKEVGHNRSFVSTGLSPLAFLPCALPLSLRSTESTKLVEDSWYLSCSLSKDSPSLALSREVSREVVMWTLTPGKYVQFGYIATPGWLLLLAFLCKSRFFFKFKLPWANIIQKRITSVIYNRGAQIIHAILTSQQSK